MVPGSVAENCQHTGTGFELARNDLDQGALASSIGAHQSGDARQDVKTDMVESHHQSIPATHLASFNDRSTHSGFTFRLRMIALIPTMMAAPTQGAAPSAVGKRIHLSVRLVKLPRMGRFSMSCET